MGKSLSKAGKDTTPEERQIDLMAFQNVHLTYDEVLVVDPVRSIRRKDIRRFDLEKGDEMVIILNLLV